MSFYTKKDFVFFLKKNPYMILNFSLKNKVFFIDETIHIINKYLSKKYLFPFKKVPIVLKKVVLNLIYYKWYFYKFKKNSKKILRIYKNNIKMLKAIRNGKLILGLNKKYLKN